MNINEIFIRRSNKIVLEKSNQSNQPSNDKHIATIIKNLEAFGYTLNQDIINVLKRYSIPELTEFYISIKTILFQLTGMSKRAYKPMYPNFPQQVMDMDESELYLNAIIHYISVPFGVTILPEYEEEQRMFLLDENKPIIISLGTEDEFIQMCNNIILSKTSISNQDKKDLTDYLTSVYVSDLPFEIPFKENAMFVCKTLLNNSTIYTTVINKYIKTATDILRLAVALSDGDISLAEKTNFKKFKRSERRLFLILLENINNPLEDMNRNRNEWVKLGEIIHPGEYKKKFPKAFELFKIIRSNKNIKTFNTEIEWLLNRKCVVDAVLELSKRPGELARRLDHLLRLSSADFETNLVINRFAKVASDISTPVLLQVMTHFQHRNDDKDLRIIFPKGNVSKVQAIKNELPNIDKKVCNAVSTVCGDTLMQRFGKLGFIGDVYIDPILKNYIVPFSQRSASNSLKTLVRGSKINLPEGDTIRLFTWWKNLEDNAEYMNRVDVDLSVVMYNDDWSYNGHISYTNLKNEFMYHSGDITTGSIDGVNSGASEYIDINITQCPKNVRYIVINLLSYTGQPFNVIPEASCGFMVRQYPNSGEIYEPSTLHQKIDLTSNTKICIPAVIDITNRQFIWGDVSLNKNPNYQNNIEGNLSSIGLLGKSLTEIVKPNLYDLLKLHVDSRGRLVNTSEQAMEVFDESFAYQIDKIIANYL